MQEFSKKCSKVDAHARNIVFVGEEMGGDFSCHDFLNILLLYVSPDQLHLRRLRRQLRWHWSKDLHCQCLP